MSCGVVRTHWTIRRSARILITSQIIAHRDIVCMESRKACAMAAIRTSHSELWKLTTFCRVHAAARIIQIICRSFAPAAIEAKATRLWLSGGRFLHRMEKSKSEQQLQTCFAATRENNDHRTKAPKVTARAIKPLATESWCQQVTPDKSKSVSFLRIENDKGGPLVGYLR